MFHDISCDKNSNDKECLANARIVEVVAKKFGVGQWSLMAQDQRNSGILRKRMVHKEFRIISHKKMLLEFAAS